MPCHPCHPSRYNGTKPLSRVGNLQGMEGMTGRGDPGSLGTLVVDGDSTSWGTPTPVVRRPSFTPEALFHADPPGSSRSPRANLELDAEALVAQGRRATGADLPFAAGLHGAQTWALTCTVGRRFGLSVGGSAAVVVVTGSCRPRGARSGAPRPRSDRQFGFAHRARNRRPVSSRGLISPKLRRTVISDM
jgi:hypothetical protein